MILLTRAVAGREIIARCCGHADRHGIHAGMDLSHARTLLPGAPTVHTQPHRPDDDERALRALARWALRISPKVALDHPDTLLIDITGTQRLYGTEARVVRSVARAIRRKGLNVRLALAASVGSAWAVCHFAPAAWSIIAPGDDRRAIADLPVESLRIGPDITHALHELAIERVSDLLRLPQASLHARFDPLLIQRLRQALGEVAEPLNPISPPGIPVASLLFEGPTEQWESIHAGVRHVTKELITQLTALHRGARRLDLTLLRPHMDPLHIQINLSRASACFKHVWTIIHSRLERCPIDTGIEGVELLASRTARLRHEQTASSKLGADEEAFDESARAQLIDELIARLGPDRVTSHQLVESHLPERAVRTQSALLAFPRSIRPQPLPVPRPTTLFAKPEPARIMALTPDGPVLQLTWRDVTQRVIACSGPERISPEWWRWNPANGQPIPRDRDYYIASCEDGRLAWLTRHVSTGHWHVHGEWS